MRDKTPHVKPASSAGSRDFPHLLLEIALLNGDGSVFIDPQGRANPKELDLSEQGSIGHMIRLIVWAGHNGKTVKIIPKN